MRHAVGSLAGVALAVGILAWPVGSTYANGPTVLANGPFVHDPNVQVFTPTPQVRDAELVEPTAEVQQVVINVVVDGPAVVPGYAIGVARVPKHRRGFGHRGFRKDWSFGVSRGFRHKWAFGFGHGFKPHHSFFGGRKFGGGSFRKGHKFGTARVHRTGRGFKGGRSFVSSRGFGAGRSFGGGRGGFGGSRH